LDRGWELASEIERWIEKTTAFGVFITDRELIIRFANTWLIERAERLGKRILHQPLFASFPEIVERKMDVFFREALQGQIKFLAPKFHRYLIALPADSPIAATTLMYQRAVIYPLPMNGGGEVSGVLTYINDVTDRVMKERRLKETIAEQENFIMALNREKRVNESMAELAEALISSRSLKDISGLVLKKALSLTESPIGLAGYIDPQNGFLTLPTLSQDVWENCRMDQKSIVFKKFGGLWGSVVREGKMLVANDAKSDPRFSGIPPGHVAIHRFLGAPAKMEGRVVGLVAVANATRPYSREDERLLERISSLHALAIYRHQMESRLYEVSVTDVLTGINNRRGFFALAEQQLKIADRVQKGLSLIFVDLDGLKEINDTLGHAEGDNAIREMAGILKKSFRRADIIARMGGDEFAIMTVNVTPKKAKYLVEKLRDLLNEANQKEGRKYRLSASIGMEYYDPKKPCDLDTLIMRADHAMYREKKKNRGGLKEV